MNVGANRAERNRTIILGDEECATYKPRLLRLTTESSVAEIENTTIWQDIFDAMPVLPRKFIDLLFVDPPYNLNKAFNSTRFAEMKESEYEAWIDSWLSQLVTTLKPTASVYICGDWRSSAAIHRVMSRYLIVRNRITWERDKGRGALANWKNCSEDIWFGTVSNEYYFNPDAVKLKRKVIAPYRDQDRKPKDWIEEGDGNFRLTYPSNIWTELTIPFWSMPENTDHPTQKPEKLMAKVILASSRKGDFVFDPFLGVGTTSVVAKKLGRRYCGVEIDEHFACLAEKRLGLADVDMTVQGYHDGVFWERNTLGAQQAGKKTPREQNQSLLPFPD